MKDDEKIVSDYYKKNVITILNSYSKKTMYLFYSIVYKKIIDRYGKEFIDNDLLNQLLENGKIFTANIVLGNGSFDERNGNILINHYLDKLTTFLFHEIVHKISWIRSGRKGNKLNNVSNEGGVNIVTNESLKTSDGKMLYFGKYLAMHPNIVNDTYLTYELFMSQLNQIVGDEELPRSILNGNNNFDKKCEKIFGKEKYDKLISKIRNIHTKNDFYWREYENQGDKFKTLEKELSEKVEDTQNQILTYSFDVLSQDIKDKQEAEEFLSRLVSFANYRIRSLNGKKTEDVFFVDYYKKKKKELEEKIGAHLKTQYDDTAWDNKYKFVRLDVEEVPKKELDEIRERGYKVQKKIKLRRVQAILGIGDTKITTISGPLYKNKSDLERVQGKLIKELQDKYKAKIESSKKEKEDR